jgi:2-polyprenyl-3-methyl-5-hydroxy-6-metoxy-1,4-benzoquinol methylase
MVSCPLCESDEFESLAKNDRYRMGICTVGCRKCGLVLTNPRPTPDALHEFYRRHYRRFYRKADRPSLEYIREYDLDKRASYTADFLEDVGALKGGLRILDVGCAEGSLLREIGQRSPTAKLAGIEPATEFSEFARMFGKCSVYPTLRDLSSRRPSMFDLIVVNHVLEHTDHPIHFLEELSQILSAEGYVYVDVPDASAYSSLNDLHIAHLYHFSDRTLTAIAEKSRLTVTRIESHAPPRHPSSLRALLKKTSEFQDRAKFTGVLEEREIHATIRTIDQGAWVHHFRQSFLGRLVGSPMRKAQALLSNKRTG